MDRVLGMRLKELRESRGMTQDEVARLLRMERPGYSKYESGATIPPLDRLAALADYFGVSVDYLIGRTDVPLLYKHPIGEMEDGQPATLQTTEKDRPSEDERSQLLEAMNSGKAIHIRKPKDLPKDRKELERFVRELIQIELKEAEVKDK